MTRNRPKLSPSLWALQALVPMLLAAMASTGCKGTGEMTINDVDPKAGHLQGEQTVRIVGQNFRPDIGYTVYFGSRRANAVTLLDPQTLLVSTPSQDTPGSVDITVRADNGNAFRITQGFRYEDMGGSVVEKLGERHQGPKQSGSKLVY